MCHLSFSSVILPPPVLHSLAFCHFHLPTTHAKDGRNLLGATGDVLLGDLLIRLIRGIKFNCGIIRIHRADRVSFLYTPPSLLHSSYYCNIYLRPGAPYASLKMNSFRCQVTTTPTHIYIYAIQMCLQHFLLRFSFVLLSIA